MQNDFFKLIAERHASVNMQPRSLSEFHFKHRLFLQFLFLIHSFGTLLFPSSLTDRITSCPTIHSRFVLSPALLPPSGIVFFALRNRMEIIESEEVSMHHNYLLAHSLRFICIPAVRQSPLHFHLF